MLIEKIDKKTSRNVWQLSCIEYVLQWKSIKCIPTTQYTQHEKSKYKQQLSNNNNNNNNTPGYRVKMLIMC